MCHQFTLFTNPSTVVPVCSLTSFKVTIPEIARAMDNEMDTAREIAKDTTKEMATVKERGIAKETVTGETKKETREETAIVKTEKEEKIIDKEDERIIEEEEEDIIRWKRDINRWIRVMDTAGAMVVTIRAEILVISIRCRA